MKARETQPVLCPTTSPNIESLWSTHPGADLEDRLNSAKLARRCTPSWSVSMAVSIRTSFSARDGGHRSRQSRTRSSIRVEEANSVEQGGPVEPSICGFTIRSKSHTRCMRICRAQLAQGGAASPSPFVFFSPSHLIPTARLQPATHFTLWSTCTSTRCASP